MQATPISATKNKPTVEVIAQQAPTSIASNTLFGPNDTLQITHAGETYTLRKTRNNKLILIK